MRHKPNLQVLEAVRKKYLQNELSFLNSGINECIISKPYQGLKILHNIPLTLTILPKIEMLVLGGAEITVSCITNLSPQKEALKALNEANIEVKIEHHFDRDYDIHLDCCGELLNQNAPTYGAVELTQTGSLLYQHAESDYPVISIDDCVLKIAETFYGTGDGFIRAMLQQANQDIRNKLFILFGYGKVGHGIAHALKKFTNQIIVIDIKEPLETRGFTFINSENFNEIRKVIKKAYCVVTATGIKNIISNYYHFNKKDFGNAMLANMGAEDEFGPNFTIKDVLFDKKTFNFILAEPTGLKYLDPIFYAHNVSVNILLQQTIKSGYNPFPAKLANNILSSWKAIHSQ